MRFLPLAGRVPSTVARPRTRTPLIHALVATLVGLLLTTATPPASAETAIPPGFPDASSTGPRDGVALRPSGDVTVESDGAVVSGLDVDGCISVRADDVTIRDVRVRCGGHHGIDFARGTSGGVVEHVEVDGLDRASNGIRGGDGITVRHTDISGASDGLKVASRSRYEANWIHDLTVTSSSHNDGMQMMVGEDVVIVGNSIDLVVQPGVNAGVWIKQDAGPIRGVHVEGNYFDGAGYHVKVGNGEQVTAVDNVHSRDHRWGVYHGEVDVRGARWTDGSSVQGNAGSGGGGDAGQSDPEPQPEPESDPEPQPEPGSQPAPAPGSSSDADEEASQSAPMPRRVRPLEAPDATTASIEVARRRFPAGADRRASSAVVARADEFADSLAGAALTGDAPLLLTPGDRLPEQLRGELDRLLDDGAPVLVLGGPAAIGEAVVAELRAMGLDPRRLAGADRIGTALAIADHLVAEVGTPARAMLARAGGSGDDPTAAWADAVTGGAHGAATDTPVLLTDGERLHPDVRAWLDRHAVDAVLLGGEAALSSEVATALGDPARVAGPDRAATAAGIAADLWGAPAPDRAVVVHGWRGDGWAYGLAAAGLAADGAGPVVVVGDHLPEATDEALRCADPVVVLGPEPVVDGAAVYAIGEARCG